MALRIAATHAVPCHFCALVILLAAAIVSVFALMVYHTSLSCLCLFLKCCLFQVSLKKPPRPMRQRMTEEERGEEPAHKRVRTDAPEDPKGLT